MVSFAEKISTTQRPNPFKVDEHNEVFIKDVLDKEKNYHGHGSDVEPIVTSSTLINTTTAPETIMPTIYETTKNQPISTMNIVIIAMSCMVFAIAVGIACACAFKRYRAFNPTAEPREIEMPVMRKFRETAV